MTTTTETTKRDAAFTVSRVINMLRTLSPDMPMQQADILFQVVLHPGLTMAELSKRTGLSQSSVSRNIQALSKFHRLGKPGLDLVDVVIDPRESRRRLIFLTASGKAFVTKLLRNVDADYSFDRETDARLQIERMHEEAMEKAEPASTRGRINKPQ
ncbi:MULTISPECIES: MarR family winged helix-turn-helix transcriptional regulator [unclassified Rhizobium]|uniref:MarR family winged helix-turn-helix transcriptional regulator n=1 Tax=unclassified Rhizobium TaxID=2613769 RepID=UPI00177C01E7|nr:MULTISPECIES: helix-turn-helix domain-containing protein [unclassified Rhizobium]MBD8687068.1 MarR family transcriptional regulator [Rhizobium sp. CFBP 13644]MBD8691129.1 MarR family transcriptional regulator [Rhizobium sp. CFBP 13717]